MRKRIPIAIALSCALATGACARGLETDEGSAITTQPLRTLYGNTSSGNLDFTS